MSDKVYEQAPSQRVRLAVAAALIIACSIGLIFFFALDNPRTCTLRLECMGRNDLYLLFATMAGLMYTSLHHRSSRALILRIYLACLISISVFQYLYFQEASIVGILVFFFGLTGMFYTLVFADWVWRRLVPTSPLKK